MDGVVILEFTTQTGAQACLDAANSGLAAYRQSQGYTLDADGDVIGKNAETGQDVASAVTTCWDLVKSSPDNTFYFVMPSFPVDLSAFTFTERAFPDAWSTD